MSWKSMRDTLNEIGTMLMRIHLPAELSPAFPYDIAVKLVNQALLLEHRDELVGAKESVDRIMPARQCSMPARFPVNVRTTG